MPDGRHIRGKGIERPELDLLDGLRLEYVAGVVRFFAGIPELWITGGFMDSEKYSGIVLVAESGCSDVDEAVEQLSSDAEKVVLKDGSKDISCHRFSIGSQGTETNFTVICSEDFRKRHPDTEFCRI